MTPDEILIERCRFVEVANSFIGTPYHDKEDKKGLGVDCAGFPKAALVEAELFDVIETPFYDPQRWMRRGYEDKTFLNVVLGIYDEIEEKEILPGDLVLYKIASSWTHGGVVMKWPDYILHAVKGKGVIGSHGTSEGFWKGKSRRYFRLKRWRS